MGYSITLTDKSKNLEESDVEKLVKKMPAELAGEFGASKQIWGWSAACDLSIEKYSRIENNCLIISGAYFSAHYAKPMAEWWAKELTKLGYSIEVDFSGL